MLSISEEIFSKEEAINPICVYVCCQGRSIENFKLNQQVTEQTFGAKFGTLTILTIAHKINIFTLPKEITILTKLSNGKVATVTRNIDLVTKVGTKISPDDQILLIRLGLFSQGLHACFRTNL